MAVNFNEEYFTAFVTLIRRNHILNIYKYATVDDLQHMNSDIN